jgi:hypothetical protein
MFGFLDGPRKSSPVGLLEDFVPPALTGPSNVNLSTLRLEGRAQAVTVMAPVIEAWNLQW